MKSVMILALLFSCISAHGQTANLTAEQVVKRIITSGTIEGNEDKQVSRLGDAAAAAATKYIGDKLVRGEDITDGDVDGALVVLHAAFAAPGVVEATPDREPRIAILLLEFLSTKTTNPGVKRTISDTKAYVLEQFSKSKTN